MYYTTRTSIIQLRRPYQLLTSIIHLSVYLRRPYQLPISIIQLTLPKRRFCNLRLINCHLLYCYLAFVLFIVLWLSITHTLNKSKIICEVDVLIGSATKGLCWKYIRYSYPIRIFLKRSIGPIDRKLSLSILTYFHGTVETLFLTLPGKDKICRDTLSALIHKYIVHDSKFVRTYVCLYTMNTGFSLQKNIVSHWPRHNRTINFSIKNFYFSYTYIHTYGQFSTDAGTHARAHTHSMYYVLSRVIQLNLLRQSNMLLLPHNELFSHLFGTRKYLLNHNSFSSDPYLYITLFFSFLFC